MEGLANSDDDEYTFSEIHFLSLNYSVVARQKLNKKNAKILKTSRVGIGLHDERSI